MSNEPINKSPAFQFYPKDYLSDKKVLRLTYEEKGVYLTLLCHMWADSLNQCSIEKDYYFLGKILNFSAKKTEKFFKIFQYPGLELFEEINNFYVSKRLREEKIKQMKTGRKRAEAANKRWGNNKCKSNAIALQEECFAFSFSSSSSLPPISPENNYAQEWIPPDEISAGAKEKYQKILKLLESILPQETFDTWFAPCVGYSFEKDKLVVAVPNTYYLNWIKENHKDVLENNNFKVIVVVN